MRKSLILLLFVSISFFGQAQISEAQLFQIRLQQKVTTLKINVSDYSFNTIRGFKKECERWSGKVNQVSLDSANMIIAIQHNGLWAEQEISEMLAKHGISRKKIISDN